MIMVAVFAAFVPEGDANIKPIALALAVGVFVDAFFVRMIFVPAVLALLGHAAWWLPGWLDRSLPMLDIEGEGLRAELALADWPAPHSTEVIHAEGLGLDGPEGSVFSGVDLAVQPGTVVVVHGPPGSGKTALLLALAGRMPVSAGRLKVVGHGLPGSGRSARAIRAQVGLAETAGINDLEESLTVEQHVAERIATQSLRLWVSVAAVSRVLDAVDDAFRNAGHAPLLRKALVADLSPLERKVLGLALAMIGRPALVVLDNVDELRNPDDRLMLWRALAWLAGWPVPADGTGPGALTVIASCIHPAEAIAAVPSERLQLLDLTETHSMLEKVY
jgi:RND superfamily putative drug exporter